MLERSRWVLADCIGVIGAGMQESEMRAFVKLHLSSAVAGKVSVIGAIAVGYELFSRINRAGISGRLFIRTALSGS